MSLRILLFIESGGPGGAERVVLDLARELRLRGEEVSVLTLRTGWLTEQLVEAGVPLLQFDKHDRSRAALPFSIARALHYGGFQLLHSHLLDSNFYGALGARIAGCPHIATEHGDVHHTSPKKLLRTKLRAMALLGSRLTAVSQFTARRLVEAGVPSSSISVLGNPVTPLLPDSADRSALRAELGIAAEEWVWLHVANLRPVKDQESLIRGFALARSHTTAPQRLCIVGDGDLRARLESIATEVGLDPNQIFFGFQKDVRRFLNASDGFVLTSLSEALPMSILEAASAGLAVIATAVGGVPELVVPGKTGWLVPPRDPQAIAEAMTCVVENPQAARALGLNARLFTESRFSPQKISADLARLYSGENLPRWDFT